MNTRLGKSFGLAFVVAVGILALMFALGTFSSQQVGANDADDGAAHDNTDHTVAHTSVDLNVRNPGAGATRQIVVMFEDSVARRVGTTISITLPSFGIPGTINADSVTISDVGSDLTANPRDIVISGDTITLEVPDMGSVDGDQGVVARDAITVRFQAAAGVTLPTAAGIYSVTVDDAAGETVMGTQLLKGAQPQLTDLRVVFSALDAQPGDTQGQLAAGLTEGELTTAGINVKALLALTEAADPTQDAPTAYTATAVPYIDPDGDEDAPERLQANVIGNNGITISRSLSLSDDDGARGTEVTLTGKGFASVQKVYVESDDEAGVGNDDHVLALDPTLTKNAFEITFTVDEGFDAGPNEIRVLDRADAVLDATATFEITGKISLSSDTAQPGDEVTVDFEDFVDPTIDNAAAHKIGGQDVTLTGDAAKSRTLEVPPGTSGGTKTVSIMVSGKAYTATISITGLPLTVDPSTAVPGQDITIRGDGFTSGAALEYIKIDGEPVDLGTTEILVSGGGNVIANVRVPKTVEAEGDNVLVEVKEYGDRDGDNTIEANQQEGNSRIGTTRMTIPEPTLTLNPTLSRPDTTVTATGTGYVAGANVNIKYVDATTSVNADSAGNWVKAFTVPINTRVPSENKVVAESGVNSTTEAHKTANATHEVPGGTLSVSPSSGLPGDSITITADGFQAYSPVVKITIGNLAIPHGGVNTDADGDFQLTVTLPALPEGTHSLFVGVGGTAANPANSDILVFTIASSGPATLPSADAFADLIAAGNLVVVWHFDNDTKGWSFYDPRPEVAAAVDLNEVTSGDNVWIQITTDQEFQGEMLTAGWNLVTLN